MGRSEQNQGRGQSPGLAPPLGRKRAGGGLTLLFQVGQATSLSMLPPPQHPPPEAQRRVHPPGTSGARSPDHQTPRKRTASPGEADLFNLPWKNVICGKKGVYIHLLQTWETLLHSLPGKKKKREGGQFLPIGIVAQSVWACSTHPHQRLRN